MMKARINRIYYQISALAFFNLPFLANYLKAIPVPVLHCYACPLAVAACPIGTIQFFLMNGQVPFYSVGLIFLFGILLGRSYCGYLCPFGFLQDLFFKFSRKEYFLPHWFGYLKYAILIIFVIILPLIFLSPIFCKICPAGTLEAGIPVIAGELIAKVQGNLPFGISPLLEMIGLLFYLKLVFLALGLTAFIFFKRPFCKICPLGAIFSFFNAISLWNNKKIEFNLCTHCHSCVKICPAGIDPVDKLNSGDCLKCNDCAHAGCNAIIKSVSLK
jgi:polyferredoxin